MSEISYRYCHFPPAIVHNAVWLYCRLTLSFRDLEGLSISKQIVEADDGGIFAENRDDVSDHPSGGRFVVRLLA